jgi:hypothetical protein
VTAQSLRHLKAKNIIEKLIHERPQDIKSERPQPISKLRKLSDSGMDCQLVKGVGLGMLSRENWMCSELTAKL